jgi:signal transduction histidine kinase
LLSQWPIRVKLAVGLAVLVVMVAILASSGLYGVYTYRTVVKSLSGRVGELPLAADLGNRVSDLRVTLSELRGLRSARTAETGREPPAEPVRMLREQFRTRLGEAEASLDDYREQLEHPSQTDSPMADNQPERQTVSKIESALQDIRRINEDAVWMFDDAKVAQLEGDLERLQSLAVELPSHLHAKLRGFSAEVRGQYRALIVGIWITSVLAAGLFALFVRLFFKWIFTPLRVLIQGSRRVARGDFGYRIHLQTHDEMSELAEAMNDMTARFQAIRDDLDRKVQERTKQVVRNEQLASVGFLAAGVAHEINNPLASIAMCAESLEGRIGEVLDSHSEADCEGDCEQHNIIRNYLGMIQNEAFRCKEITEKLLDFSRIGPPKRQETELRELVQGVINMIGHLGKYQGKRIELLPGDPVVAPVNAQEIRQVVLNLLTNALDSLDDDGAVRIELATRNRKAELTVTDNGCGMEPAVLEHVFEPFFTRRRAGQGTGLGLSITYRIVADHGGTIEARSPGPGLGATFRVRLPLVQTQKNAEPRREAA